MTGTHNIIRQPRLGIGMRAIQARDALEVRPVEVRAFEVRPVEVCSFEMCIVEIGTF